MKIQTILLLLILTPILFAQDLAFKESEIFLTTSSGYISGTITIPEINEAIPVVIIIAGSGPTDRDGNSPLGVQTNAYKMLADSFARNGIASLRYDKRGIAKSKEALKNEMDIRFEMYVDDVISWISLLKKDKRFSSIILLGHSEGSLIGMIAANRSEINAFISVAGSGKTVDKILQEQLKNKLLPNLMIESNRILDSLKKGKTVSNVNPNLMSIYRPSIQPYMISWLKYNPSKEINKIKTPVLIIQGTTDLQVSVEDAKILSASKQDAKLVIISNMNHVLKESEIDTQKNFATYGNPNLALKKEFVVETINFINTLQK